MSEKRVRRSMLAIVSVCLLGLIIGGFALITNNLRVDNVFQAKNASAVFEETFTPPMSGDEIYGNTYNKSGYVNNLEGEDRVKARLKLQTGWYDTNEIEGAPTIANTYEYQAVSGPINRAVATLVFNGNEFVGDYALDHPDTTLQGGAVDATQTGWHYEKDGYFYWNGKSGTLDANEKTLPFLKHVMFDDGLAEKVSVMGYRVMESAQPNTMYATQQEAQAAAKAEGVDAKLEYTQVMTYKYKLYEGKYYVVQIDCEIIDGDKNWT